MNVDEDSWIELGQMPMHRRVLGAAGGPFPTLREGLPVLPYVGPSENDEYFVEHWRRPPLPEHGWREVTGDPADGFADVAAFGVVLATPEPWYPSPDPGPREWLTVHLHREGPHWQPGEPWSERVRPNKDTRRRGLTLDWPDGDLESTAAGLQDLRVRLSRPGGPLGWDEHDGRHVVGWVHRPDRELPFQAWQAFGGPGAEVPPDAVEVWLPVRWITDDVGNLPPGEYVVTATLTGMNVKTGPRPLRLVDSLGTD